MERKMLYRKIVHEIAHSYSYSSDSPFTLPLHCHEEYELLYIISGNGQEFVGNSMKRYAAGDLMLIGSGVPHLHLCDAVEDKIQKKASVIFCSSLKIFYPKIYRQFRNINMYIHYWKKVHTV